MSPEVGHPIKVVARRTGLSPHLIRIWERRYRAVVPNRTGTNRRLYSDEDIERLLLLQRAVQAGRSISSIAHLSSGELQSLIEQDSIVTTGAASPRKVLTHNSPDFFVQTCVAAVGELNPERLDATLRQASVVLSQPALIERVIVPLMYRIGEMWRLGECRITSEHIASAVVRNFLGNFGLTYETSPNAPVIVLTTPPGFLHEFGALVAAVTAASEGWQVIYLGPNLPMEEIALAARKRQARAVGLSLVYPSDDQRLGQDLTFLRRMLPEQTQILVGGSCAPSYAEAVKKVGGRLVTDLADLGTQLNTLRQNLPRIRDLE